METGSIKIVRLAKGCDTYADKQGKNATNVCFLTLRDVTVIYIPRDLSDVLLTRRHQSASLYNVLSNFEAIIIFSHGTYNVTEHVQIKQFLIEISHSNKLTMPNNNNLLLWLSYSWYDSRIFTGYLEADDFFHLNK